MYCVTVTFGWHDSRVHESYQVDMEAIIGLHPGLNGQRLDWISLVACGLCWPISGEPR